jgi:hypothetical protein
MRWKILALLLSGARTSKAVLPVQAGEIDPERWALVLLGAEAGLRQGEVIALEWATSIWSPGT